jgi:hypothetical protein
MGIEVDGANQKLILDSDGDTYIEGATDDTLKVYVSGAQDFTITANTLTAESGSTIAAQALTATTVTASGIIKTDDATEATSTTDGSLQTDGGLSVVKDTVMGDDLKLLSDSSVIHFGANSEITLTHSHDAGLNLKHTATADDKPVVLTLQTGETDIAQDDVIGALNFQAPDEGTGTDAILVAAGIEAVSEGDFSSSNNATKLSFKTAASEAAAEKASLSSTGVFTATSFAGSGAGLTAGTTPLTTLDIDGGTDIGADIVDADLFVIDDGAGGTNRKTAASRLKTYIGGSKLVFIANQEGTNSVGDVSFNDCFSATYKTYFITFQLLNDRDGNNIQFRFQADDDSTFNSGYKYALHSINHSGTENNFVAANAGEVVLTGGTEGTDAGYFGVCNGFMYVHRPYTYDSDLNNCFFNIFSQEVDTGGNFKSIHGGGFLNQTDYNVAGIRFRPGANYMTNRNVTIYGLEQS